MTTSASTLGRTAGAGAMLVALLVAFVLRLSLAVPTPAELLSDTIIWLIPTPLFSATLDALQAAAKFLLLAGLVAGQFAVGALVGAGFAASFGPALPRLGFRDLLRPALLLSGAVWLLTVVIAMPLLGAGLLGADTPAGATLTTVGYLLSDASYGVGLAGLLAWQARGHRPDGAARTLRRRDVLRALGWGTLGVALAAGGMRFLSATQAAQSASPARLPEPITPTDRFYVVSKNLLGVKVDPGRWRLDVVGFGSRVGPLRLADLTALPAVELTSTLTCISNQVGGNLIGTARWTGVRLRDVIGEPAPGERAQAVVFTGWDDYADSIPLAKALDPNTILVYRMNGEPLRDEHGFPLRLIVPGLYGIKNVKWIRRIEVVGHGFVGYWQSRGWSDQAIVQTQAQIDLPRDHSVLSLGPVEVGGIAFAGDRGISRVELSPDGGTTWLPTTLQPPLSPFTWTAWTTTWRPATAGSYRLVVRATDGRGQLQAAAETPPIPDGATGYHRISVRVVPA